MQLRALVQADVAFRVFPAKGVVKYVTGGSFIYNRLRVDLYFFLYTEV